MNVENLPEEEVVNGRAMRYFEPGDEAELEVKTGADDSVVGLIGLDTRVIALGGMANVITFDMVFYFVLLSLIFRAAKLFPPSKVENSYQNCLKSNLEVLQVIMK